MTDKRLHRLIKELNHNDPSKRRLAAEGLASADERAIYPLIKALWDESPGVQDASIQSLISIGGEATIYMTTPLLRDDSPFIRNAAIVILRSLGQVSIPFLYGLLRDRDDDVRKFALDILGEIRDGVLPERILPLLRDINPNVRASAARVLGLLGQKSVLPHLIEALNDEEWVAFAAIEAIGRIGDESALNALMKILLSTSETLRLTAIEAIGRIGTEAARDILQGHFSKTEGLEREMTVKSLIRLNTIPEDKGIAEFILKLFIESEWEDRLLYLKGLSKLQYHKAIPLIIDMVGSIDPSMPDSEDIIQEVKDRLKEFGCSDPLIDVIKDPHFRFRGKVIAIDLIGDFKCKRAIPFLIELLKTDLRDVRRASISAIGGIDGEVAKKVLIESVDDYDGHVRKAAIIALGRISAKEAFEPIMRILDKEPYEDVLEEAIKSLLRIDRERFLSMRHGFRGVLLETIERIVETQAFLGEDR